MKPLGFDPGKFILNESHFDHQSLLHGINHTYRVMCHVMLLGEKLEWERETRLAFCAAFIHDMARKHDGYCSKHGLWSTENKLPVFAEFFMSQGANAYELEEIGTAVRNHSEGFELHKDHAFWKTTALLKDADALDRIRLGHGNLNVTYLRLDPTPTFIPLANDLYFSTSDILVKSFTNMLEIAKKNESNRT
ncbi:MAG: HD domain-containing protein [Bacteroidales bacterium]|nr:HD domain-containing protein [Bacteroidales bacterium]